MAFFPICELSPWCRKSWTIKARVSQRSQTPREFNKDGRTVKLLSFELLDADGVDIRATVWGTAGVEKWDSYLKNGRVYTFAKGSMKVANRNYGSCTHSYEISFDEHAEIVMLENDDSIQQVKFTRLTPLRDLASMTVLPGYADVIVVVTEAKDRREATTKNGLRQLREITVADASECSLEVGLWEGAALCDLARGSVLCIKGLRVSDFSGRNGSVFDRNCIFTELDTPQVDDIRAWWASNSNVQLRNLSNGEVKTAGETKEGSLEEFEVEAAKLQEGQTLYWRCRTYFAFLRTKTREGQAIPLWYMACPTCSRKLDMQGECTKCQKRVNNPQMRYMFGSVLLEDEETQRWCGAFHDAAMSLVDVSPEKLSQSLEGSVDSKIGKVDNLLSKRFYFEQYQIKLRAKVEAYEGQIRMKPSVVRVDPLNVPADAEAQLADLKALYSGASDDAQAEVNAMLNELAWQDEHIAGAPSLAKGMAALRTAVC